PPPSPHPGRGRAAAGKKCSAPSRTRGALGRRCQGRLRSVGVSVGPGARPERPSIRGGPATVPSTLYRIRLGRPARQEGEPTPRTNGALAGSPGGTAAALTDLP